MRLHKFDILIVFIFSFVSVFAYSQEFHDNILIEEKSGIKFTEIKLKNDRIIPIKSVFFIVDTISQENTILAVKKSIAKEKMGNAVFYFAKFPKDDSIVQKEKFFKDIVLNFLERMKMIESQLYVVSTGDFTNEYDRYSDNNELRGFDFANLVRCILLNTDINKILDFIDEKHKLPPDYYDKKR